MAPPSLTGPIAVGHFYLAEDKTWKPEWDTIPWTAVDVVNLSPFGIISKDKFDVLKPFQEDFIKEFITKVRSKNSNIKILAQQWWEHRNVPIHYTLEKGLGSIDDYVNSVKKCMSKYDLDGWDLDYEEGNEIAKISLLLTELRKGLDTLTGKTHYMTISPASPLNLEKNSVSNALSWVNIQTYSGGWWGNGGPQCVQNYIDLGFTSKQLTYGILPESPAGTDGHSPKWDEVMNAYNTGDGKGNKLGGINTWRLNSNMDLTTSVQIYIANTLHNKGLKAPLTLDQVKAAFTGQN